MAILSGTTQRLTATTLQTRQSVWVEAFVVIVIIAIGTALRFTLIGAKSFWVDEAYSAYLASHSTTEIIAISAREDAHPPLYHVLLALWSRALGTDDVALRSLGAVASVLTVGVTWWVGRQLGGPFIGSVAASLTAISPFQVLAAQEARMYTLLGFLTLLSWAALLVALEGRRWAWIAYVTVTTLALYTHYFAFLSLIGQGIFVLGTAIHSRQSWLVSQLAVLVFYLPWLGKFLDTFFSGRFWPFYRPPIGIETLTGLLGFLSFGGHVLGFEGWFREGTAPLVRQLIVLIPFLALALIGVLSLRDRSRIRWFLAGSLVVPVVIAFAFSLRYNVFASRYFSFLSPPFAMLLAFGIQRIAVKTAPAFHRVTALGLGLICLLFNAPVLQGVYTNPLYNTFNWRGVATSLAAEARPNDLIVIIPAYGSFPFSRYFRGPQQIVPMDPYELDRRYTGRVLEDPAVEASSRALFRSYAAQHEVMWVVVGGSLSSTMLKRLGKVLDGIYDLQGVAAFNAIRVFKTRRH